MFGNIQSINMSNPTKSLTATKFQNTINTGKKSSSKIMINMFKQPNNLNKCKQMETGNKHRTHKIR